MMFERLFSTSIPGQIIRVKFISESCLAHSDELPFILSWPSFFYIKEEGWPLGLQPLNVRIGLGGRTRSYFGSMSFNTTTVLTGSPTSSTDSSSDLDTESTGSFFHDRSITLGSLIGVSSILELSRRSIRGRRPEPLKVKKSCKTRPWIFSLCSRDSIDVENSTTTTPSLGQFLAVERRTSNNDQTRRNQSPRAFVPDEISLAQPIPQASSLFVNGRIAPPQSSPWSGLEIESGHGRGMEQGNNGYGVPVLFSCMCGQDSH